MNRILLSCLAVSLVGVAQASFTLALVADNVGRCIHRYDLDSGVYLGKFGQFALGSAYTMGLDQTRNKLYVGESSTIKAFNYNTGEYLYSMNGITSVGLGVFSNGDLLTSTGGSVSRINSTTGATINTYNLSAGGLQGTVAGIAVDENDRVYISDAVVGSTSNNARIDVFGGTGTYILSSAVYTQRLNNSYQQMTARGGKLAIGSDTLGGHYQFNYTNSTMVYGLTGFSYGGMTQSMGNGFGHGNLLYVTGMDGSGNPLLQVTDSYSMTTTIPTPQISTNGMRQMAIVVAPEPGTIAALALGIAFLNRRRKR
ncbi:MAG: PEP-CTERM sorting domain-containing protein [Armatimonadetes bacterium]|nr:PEP-CTERM sorting domain-containing protein [Armatimonadota bacterium]